MDSRASSRSRNFVEKIKLEFNVADIGTKPLIKDTCERCRGFLGLFPEAAIEDEERVAAANEFGYSELADLMRVCSNKSFVQTLRILLRNPH